MKVQKKVEQAQLSATQDRGNVVVKKKQLNVKSNYFIEYLF